MTQTITLKVSIDCDACKKKVKKALDGIKGVETIDVDMKNERVTVVGSMEPKLLVKRLAKVGKKVELPGGHGKGQFHNNDNNNDNNNNNSFSNFGFGKGSNKNKNNNLKGRVASADMDDGDDEDVPPAEVYAHIFSDENANSCAIM